MRKVVKNIIKIYIILSIILCITLIVKLFVVGTESKVKIENIKSNTYELNGRKVYEIIEATEIENVIIYLHGGAYVEGIKENQIEFLKQLSKESNSKIVLPDYPLSPKYTYIDVFEMIKKIYNNEINTNNAENKKTNIVLMGDSAGGGMALGLLKQLEIESNTLPFKTILLSPWIDVTMQNPEIENVIPFDKKLNKEVLKLAGISYAGENGMESHLVNPILGSYEKIDNIYILSGTSDILNPDAKKLIMQNPNINYLEYKDAQHIFMLEDDTQQKEKAFRDVLNILNK